MRALFAIDKMSLPVINVARIVHGDASLQLSLELGRDAGLRNGANGVALRMIEIVLAFRALLGVDNVGLVFERDRSIRAFEFASAANGALRSDDLISHGSAP